MYTTLNSDPVKYVELLCISGTLYQHDGQGRLPRKTSDVDQRYVLRCRLPLRYRYKPEASGLQRCKVIFPKSCNSRVFSTPIFESQLAARTFLP